MPEILCEIGYTTPIFKAVILKSYKNGDKDSDKDSENYTENDNDKESDNEKLSERDSNFNRDSGTDKSRDRCKIQTFFIPSTVSFDDSTRRL